MPIGKEEWNAGRNWESLEARVLTFLKRNQDKAFNVLEITQGIGYKAKWEDFLGLINSVSSLWKVQNAIETLVDEGIVKAKVIKIAGGEDTYYKAT
ncbi:MAG: hypothetical protein PVH12_02030 [Candidatus Bathyarchaeota archaeon]